MSSLRNIPDRPLHPAQWSSPQAQEALHFIIEGIAEMAGFHVVGVSLAREDGMLQAILVVGNDEAQDVLESTLAPTAPLLAQLKTADDWGFLLYLPGERHDLDLDVLGWAPDIAPRVAGSDLWDPRDLLVAPLYDEEDEFLGLVGLDLPVDGRVPPPERRAELNQYARQACRAVLTTLERQQLAERVRLAAAAADVVRRASGSTCLSEVLRESRESILRGFRADALWLEIFSDAPGAVVADLDGARPSPAPEFVSMAIDAARRAWLRQAVVLLDADGPAPEGLSEDGFRLILDVMRTEGMGSTLLAPLGAGSECLGALALTRAVGATDWSPDEAEVALEIGRDLGRVLATNQTFERERELMQELRRATDYRNRLVATVSHELKNPLAAMLGNLELLEEEDDLAVDAQRAVAAIARGGRRLRRAVDDLLLLYRVDGEDAQEALRLPLDLGLLVDDVLELNMAFAQRRGLTLRRNFEPGRRLILGDLNEIERIVVNLVSNALKYTQTGGVTVGLRTVESEHGDQMELSCSDTGIGMSVEDQEHVFEELFRSADPLARSQSGTGLGLAIVRRVVDRHHGRIEVESAPGEGATFRVYLPVAVTD